MILTKPILASIQIGLIVLAETADATQTAYRVGYESTSQFSREYSRMFGAPLQRRFSKLQFKSNYFYQRDTENREKTVNKIYLKGDDRKISMKKHKNLIVS